MKDVYQELPKLKIDLTISKFLVIIFVITLTFILPAIFISNYKNSASAQVAGISTQKNQDSTPLININDQSQILIIIGSLLIGISVIILIYLIIDNFIERRGGYHKYSGFKHK